MEVKIEADDVSDIQHNRTGNVIDIEKRDGIRVKTEADDGVLIVFDEIRSVNPRHPKSITLVRERETVSVMGGEIYEINSTS